MKMPHWLYKRAQLTPGRAALIADGKQWTFAELYEEASEMAQRLAQRGLQQSRVALSLRNSPEMIIVIHALTLIRCELVLLNTRLTERERNEQIERSEAQWLLTDEHGTAPIPLLVVGELTEPIETSVSLATEIDSEAVVTFMFTSGTTGVAKLIPQTYGNHWWSANGSVLNLGLHHRDKWLALLPYFHVGGLSILWRSVIYGITVVHSFPFEPERVIALIDEQRVTHVSLVTSMVQQLLTYDGWGQSLTCLLLGGGPAPLTVLQACERRGLPVYQTYGMTETCSQIVTLAPEDALRKLGSAGKPLFPCEVKIVADEIVVRGPNVVACSADEDGWLRTGDYGYVDDEGFLYVLDRRSDLIISGGENIYPAEIENVLLQFDGVQEAAVVGRRDEKWGEVPVAFIVGHHVDERALSEWCTARLAKYKCPTMIIKRDALPKNAAGKLVRRQLRGDV